MKTKDGKKINKIKIRWTSRAAKTIFRASDFDQIQKNKSANQLDLVNLVICVTLVTFLRKSVSLFFFNI
jgi:hypothetical protein